MMRKLSVYIFVTYMNTLIAQDLAWAKSIGAFQTENSSALTTDGNGCVYLTGNFNGTADLDPGPAYLPFTSNGGYDIFIQKLNQNGDLIWARTLGGASNDESYAICRDSLGNIYTTGFFEGLVDFDTGPGSFFLSGSGNEEIFVQKLDSAGNFQWARRMGGPGNDYGTAISIDSLNYIYITGTSAPSADFDPGAGILTFPGAGGYDAFVVKLNDAGNLVWAKTFGGASSEWGIDIKPGHSGFVYVTGFFHQTADFDPGPGVESYASNGGADIFLMRLDTAGNFDWVKTMGGASTDEGVSITLADAGHVYLAGQYSGLLVDLDPGPGTQSFTSQGLTTDIFIQKFDTSGNLTWVKTFGGDHLDEPKSIAHDSDGNIYTTGIFRNSVDFNPGTNAYILSTGDDDCHGMFLQKLSPSGIFQWAINTACGTMGMDLELDNTGGIYIAGNISGDNIDFDPWAEVYELDTPGSSAGNAFAMKLGPCIAPDTPVAGITGTVLCAGDSVELFVSSGNLNSAVEWQWFDNFCGGNLVGSGPSLMVAPSSATTYFVWGGVNCAPPGACDEITINPPLPFNIVTSMNDELFGSDGSITMSVSGATGPYDYQWTGPAGFSSSTEDISGLVAGNYEVTITDANGCDTVFNFIMTSFVNLDQEQNLFTATPNPATDFFCIKTSNFQGTWHVKLLDLSGRVMTETEVTGAEYLFNLSGFERGTYLLIISSGDQDTILKIVKT